MSARFGSGNWRQGRTTAQALTESKKGTWSVTSEVPMVAGVGFEPTTSGPCRIAAIQNKRQPGLAQEIGGREEQREVVAGVGFEPTTSGL